MNASHVSHKNHMLAISGQYPDEWVRVGEAAAKKLTAADVLAIRQNRRGMTDKQQAEHYGVHPNMIYRIRKRLAWGSVA